MKTFLTTVLGYLFVLTFSDDALGAPEHGMKSVYSLDRRFQLKVSATSEQYINRLAIIDQGRELAHYRFDGDLVSAYWAPSANYVAINNHFGYRGWYVWIISLRDGSVIRSAGRTKSSEYDRYSDDNYEPNLLRFATKQLENVYPKFRDDSSREKYISLAYGWESENKLRMLHVLGFDNLYEKQNAEIWIKTLFDISENGISLSDAFAEKVAGRPSEKYPSEIRKILEMK